MKNEYRITKKEVMSWAKEYHLHGAANVVLFVLWALVGLIGLGLLAILMFRGGNWARWLLAGWLVFASVYKLALARFHYSANRYKVMSRMYGVSEWIRSTEFTAEEIILTDHNSVTKFRYDNIKKIWEKQNVVMIFFHQNLALRLYKDAFVEGSWEECLEKINTMRKTEQ